MNYVIRSLKALWRNKFLGTAAILSALEALIALGIGIPGIEHIPQKYRASVIVMIMMSSFVLRVLSQRREDEYRRRHTRRNSYEDEELSDVDSVAQRGDLRNMNGS